MLNILSGFLLFTFLSAHSQEPKDNDCAKAMLGHLKSKGYVTKESNGICVGDLNSLPKVDISLGSSVFQDGSAAGKLNPATIKKLATLNHIFTGTKDFSNLHITGYADGSENQQSTDEKNFLNGTNPTELTKSFILERIAFDTRASEAVEEMLKDYAPTAKINKSEIPKVMSLVRNVYLAKQRAKNYCEQLKGPKTDCENESRGFASPTSESLGNISCDNRRRTVMTFSGQVSPIQKKEKNGRLSPPFRIPARAMDKRNMQLAAGLDLFKKLKEANVNFSDPSSVEAAIEKIMPSECRKDPTTKFNTRDNFLRTIDHVETLSKKLFEKSKDLKTLIYNGDYAKVKERLDKIIEKEEDTGLNEADLAERKIIETVLTGYDWGLENAPVNNGKDFVYVKDGKAKVITNTRKLCNDYGHGLKDITHTVDANRGNDYCSLINGKMYVYSLNKQEGKGVRYLTSYDGELREVPKSSNGEMIFANPKYPMSSVAGNSVDQLNCLSPAAALEEGLNSGEAMIGGRTYEATDYVKDDKSPLTLELYKFQIPKFTDRNNKEVYGWVCEFCHSGHKLEPGYEYERSPTKMRYDSRDVNTGWWSNSAIPNSRNEKNLNFATLKTPSIYTITRESFSGNCPANMKVCDCMKNVGKNFRLEDVLKSTHTQKKIFANELEGNKFKSLQADIPSPENTCIYVPPMGYTCRVNSQGASADAKKSGEQSRICRSLVNMIESHKEELFPGDTKSTKEIQDMLLAKYKSFPLSSLRCNDVHPTADESVNCPLVGQAMAREKAKKTDGKEAVKTKSH